VTASASKIAETRASRFVDTDVTLGTAYFYWVNAYDSVENVSGFATYATATPVAVPASSTDSTAPDTPEAFLTSLTQPGAYLSDDGTTLTRLAVSLPAMPTLGVSLNLLYKLQSGTQYSIAGKYTVGSIDAIIYDLTPGEYYTIAVQAFSAFDKGSTVRVVTGTNALAPSNTTPPDAPTAVTYISGSSSDFERPPEMIGGVVAFSVRVNWTPPATKSVLSYEAVRTSVDSDAAANTEYANGNFFRQSIPEEIFSDLSLFSGYIRVRSVDRTGQKSAWAGGGVNLISPTIYWGIPGPTLMRQNADSVEITGGTVSGITDLAISDGGTGASNQTDARTSLGLGTLATQNATATSISSLVVAPAAATSPRAHLALYAGTEVGDISPSPTLVTSISLDVDITNRGFTAKPDWGLIQIYDTNFLGVYDYDTGSSSTNARFVIFSKDGTNLGHGNRRYHFILGRY
jgi:hypothetical protein